jgi:hypothetical protein
MHPRKAYASGIHTTKCDEEHREDEYGREHTLRRSIQPRNLSAEESAYDHAQRHGYGAEGR